MNRKPPPLPIRRKQHSHIRKAKLQPLRPEKNCSFWVVIAQRVVTALSWILPFVAAYIALYLVSTAIGFTFGFDQLGGLLNWIGGVAIVILYICNETSDPAHVFFCVVLIAVVLILAVGLFTIVFAVTRRFSRMAASQINNELSNLPVAKQSVLGSHIQSWLDDIPLLKGTLKFVLWVIPGVILSVALFICMVSLFTVEYYYVLGVFVLVYLNFADSIFLDIYRLQRAKDKK